MDNMLLQKELIELKIEDLSGNGLSGNGIEVQEQINNYDNFLKTFAN